jgi:hypothetical protein
VSLPDPLDTAAAGRWDEFVEPLLNRTLAARERGEPVYFTRAEMDELNRRTKTKRVAPFDGEGPYMFFGWPVVIAAESNGT